MRATCVCLKFEIWGLEFKVLVEIAHGGVDDLGAGGKAG